MADRHNRNIVCIIYTFKALGWASMSLDKFSSRRSRGYTSRWSLADLRYKHYNSFVTLDKFHLQRFLKNQSGCYSFFFLIPSISVYIFIYIYIDKYIYKIYECGWDVSLAYNTCHNSSASQRGNKLRVEEKTGMLVFLRSSFYRRY